MTAASNDMAMVRLVVFLHGLTRPSSPSASVAPSDPHSSPSYLPTSSPSTVNPHITTPRPLVICLPAKPTTSARVSGVHCKNPGCKTTRLRAECLRTMCRRHCLAAGGCGAKSHAANPHDSTEHVSLHNASGPSRSRSLAPSGLPAPSSKCCPAVLCTIFGDPTACFQEHGDDWWEYFRSIRCSDERRLGEKYIIL